MWGGVFVLFFLSARLSGAVVVEAKRGGIGGLEQHLSKIVQLCGHPQHGVLSVEFTFSKSFPFPLELGGSGW